MANSLVYKQFNDCKQRLIEHKNNVLKCIAMNNVCYKKLKELSVVPIFDEEYKMRPKYNYAISLLVTSLKNEKIYNKSIKYKDGYWYITHENKFNKDIEYITGLTQSFYELTFNCVKEDYLCDLEFYDIEQYYYLINNIELLICEELNHAITKLESAAEHWQGNVK